MHSTFLVEISYSRDMVTLAKDRALTFLRSSEQKTLLVWEVRGDFMSSPQHFRSINQALYIYVL